jgi:hypothetical protein
MARRKNTISSNHTASTRDTRRSAESNGSRSTAPTSLYESPRPSTKGSTSRAPRAQASYPEEDLSPVTSQYARSSVGTYSSYASREELDGSDMDDPIEFSEIPPLPVYRHQIEEINVRPSTPEEFAALFPSLNRLSIRHDDFTPDGNMNLRVDTVVPSRRRRTIQLFHLRMYDLNKRDFSLRRYCRDSGREICNSKRKYVETSSASRPILQRPMSNAIKTLAGRPQLKRTSTAGSMFSSRSIPSAGYSAAEADDEFTDGFGHAKPLDKKTKSRPMPTNTIKLEFSNYARVDIQRQGSTGSKRYDFDWWGHKYSWKRFIDKITGVVSFHLMKDGNANAPVAHIVPETRAPNQVAADEEAGGWVPPCHMWISDQSLIDAMTDVTE